MHDVFTTLCSVIREVLDEPNLSIQLESDASISPDWDSLAQINILSRLEKSFQITFHLAELQNITTVGDMVTLIQGKSHE
jgi:acyl carrier protein